MNPYQAIWQYKQWLLEHILSISSLTATKLRDWLNTSQSHRKHSIENKEHGREPSLDILANYANLNVRSNIGDCN
ncbi:MAG: hypothetical protein HQK63_03830 [Desulfamplus sp.]|nr:hypothetical protein [Desulfamplus sp.]